MVDHAAQAPAIRHLPHTDETLIDRQRSVRRDDVDVVGFERLAILGVRDREPSDIGEKLGQEAFMRRIEVNDDNEDEPGLRRHGAEERLERLEAAGRCPEANDDTAPCNRLVKCWSSRGMVGRLLRSASQLRRAFRTPSRTGHSATPCCPRERAA